MREFRSANCLQQVAPHYLRAIHKLCHAFCDNFQSPLFPCLNLLLHLIPPYHNFVITYVIPLPQCEVTFILKPLQ